MAYSPARGFAGFGRLRRRAGLLLTVAALAAFGGCTSQRRLLYRPGPYTFPMVRDIAARRDLLPWPPRGEYRGLLATPAAGTVRGTVVVFHGNADIAANRSYLRDALVPLGYRVILAEYAGYGGRRGRPSEPLLARDAADTLTEAERAFGRPLFVWGESLGAAVAAAALAAGAPRPDGLVLFTPWDSLASVAAVHFPLLPRRLLLRDRYDSVRNLSSLALRTAVVLAGRDEVVPPSLGRRLYETLPEPRKLWLMPGVGHNDWSAAPSNPLWSEVMSFLAAGPADPP